MLGDHFALGKGGYFDQSQHIPLIIRGPGRARSSAASSSPPSPRRLTSSPPCSRRWRVERRPPARRHLAARPRWGRCSALLDRRRRPKLAIAQAMDKHDTVGLDLVAMVVDDLVVCGAEPLFLQDYIAVGRTVPERVAAIVAGIADGCVLAGCALLGGETAEHPGLMEPDHYDISATGRRRRGGRRRAGARTRQARRRDHRDGIDRACIPTVTRWPARCCWRSTGWTCQVTSRSSAAPSVRNCWSRPTSTPRIAWRWPPRPHVRTFCHVTGGGLAGQPGTHHPARPGGRGGSRHLDARTRVRHDRPARTHRARRDGEDLQHGRRHGRHRRAGGHRPRAGDSDRAPPRPAGRSGPSQRARRMGCELSSSGSIRGSERTRGAAAEAVSAASRPRRRNGPRAPRNRRSCR